MLEQVRGASKADVKQYDPTQVATFAAAMLGNQTDAGAKQAGCGGERSPPLSS